MTKSTESIPEAPDPIAAEAKPRPLRRSRSGVREAPPLAPSQTAAEYDGPSLRRIREQRGLTLKEIADRTRINASILSAIEDERYEDVPNARVYVRGFVRSIAIELSLDPEPVTQSYLPRWDRWFESHGHA
jgi:ribosome-binding protein aMBF1 (putative translation factor)